MTRMQHPSRARGHRAARLVVVLAAAGLLAGCAGDDGARPLPAPTESLAELGEIEQRFADHAAANGYELLGTISLATSAESAARIVDLAAEPVAFGVHCQGLGPEGSATVAVGGTVVDLGCGGDAVEETAFDAPPPESPDGVRGVTVAVVGSTGVEGRLTVAVYGAR
ncbi:MAG: hypothetical protein GXX90_04305 [Microbacteriaceae bacterium]|nr:hypothetical protein [Microbacteriaceae bacterium]